jgi:hypothetical protein
MKGGSCDGKIIGSSAIQQALLIRQWANMILTADKIEATGQVTRRYGAREDGAPVVLIDVDGASRKLLVVTIRSIASTVATALGRKAAEPP